MRQRRASTRCTDRGVAAGQLPADPCLSAEPVAEAMQSCELVGGMEDRTRAGEPAAAGSQASGAGEAALYVARPGMGETADESGEGAGGAAPDRWQAAAAHAQDRGALPVLARADQWQQALDYTSGHFYYYREATQASQPHSLLFQTSRDRFFSDKQACCDRPAVGMLS